MQKEKQYGPWIYYVAAWRTAGGDHRVVAVWYSLAGFNGMDQPPWQHGSKEPK
jgi:hypothetical protein